VQQAPQDQGATGPIIAPGATTAETESLKDIVMNGETLTATGVLSMKADKVCICIPKGIQKYLLGVTDKRLLIRDSFVGACKCSDSADKCLRLVCDDGTHDFCTNTAPSVICCCIRRTIISDKAYPISELSDFDFESTTTSCCGCAIGKDQLKFRFWAVSKKGVYKPSWGNFHSETKSSWMERGYVGSMDQESTSRLRNAVGTHPRYAGNISRNADGPKNINLYVNNGPMPKTMS